MSERKWIVLEIVLNKWGFRGEMSFFGGKKVIGVFVKI